MPEIFHLLNQHLLHGDIHIRLPVYCKLLYLSGCDSSQQAHCVCNVKDQLFCTKKSNIFPDWLRNVQWNEDISYEILFTCSSALLTCVVAFICTAEQ